MDLFDLAVANKLAGGGGGGGGGGLDLIATKSIGHITQSSTTATDTGQSVVIDDVNAYDILLVVVSADNPVANSHVGTMRPITLTAGSDVDIKNGRNLDNACLNFSNIATGKTVSKANKSANGIFPYDVTVASGKITIPIYSQYNSTYTGTIDNDYTVRVYGVNIVNLI